MKQVFVDKKKLFGEKNLGEFFFWLKQVFFLFKKVSYIKQKFVFLEYYFWGNKIVCEIFFFKCKK